jgi:hypothetical protein
MRSFVGSGTDRTRESFGRPQVEVIEIVTVPDPDGRKARGRFDAIPTSVRRVAVALALVAALVGVAAAEVVGASDRHGGPVSGSRVSGLARERGPAGVAAAYGYPLRCLSVTIPVGHRDYARADFGHAGLCGRYTWAPTAIFHRVAGAWYRVLDAVQYRCPVDSLPTAVQVQLDLCPSKPGLAGIH